MKSAAEEALSWLNRWSLVPDGPEIRTATSLLLPVAQDGAPQMLKIAMHQEEVRGNALMSWWEGRGAAFVLAVHGPAILMARADPDAQLAAMPDDVAFPIICNAVDLLHTEHQGRVRPPMLVSLDRWFAPLTQGTHSSEILNTAKSTALRLLAAATDPVVLHGDIHHGNILRFETDWRAIDPKALWGPRGFDYANIFLNPLPQQLGRDRILRRLALVSDRTGICRKELAQWVLSWAALSCIFSEMDGNVKAARKSFAFVRLARSILEDFGQSCS